MNRFSLTDESFHSPAGMDTAVSHSVLTAVSRGEIGGVFRLFVPHPTVAFGRSDRHEPGYAWAVRIAEAHGFSPIERLAGGRAAVFTHETLAFSWAMSDPDPAAGIHDRFQLIASVMTDAFISLGLDARIGQLPGEYCPGEYSVNIAGIAKVMGVGQRLVRGAAHVGGVVVVDRAERVRDILIPVYRALSLDWDPRTAGALADRAPGLTVAATSEAIIDSLAQRFDLIEEDLPLSVIAAAGSLVDTHLPEVA